MKHLKSGMPQDIIETAVREPDKDDRSDGYRVVNCFFRGKLVGQRAYTWGGILVLETPLKDGQKHGRELTWSEEGQLLSVEPYVEGKIHGTAKQYGRNGSVIGMYTMVHGTGFDVWRQEEDETVFVSEIHSLQDGLPNGYEWWFTSPKQQLWHERHWRMGKLHGIERMWNGKGRLRRGYPKFYVTDQAVSKQKYLKMALVDKTLPVFREEDNIT